MADFTSTTVTHRESELVRHTEIVAVATMSGTTQMNTSMTWPLGVYAGSIMTKSTGNNALHTTGLFVRADPAAIGGFGENDLWQGTVDMSSSTTYLPLQNIFSHFSNPDPGTLNWMSGKVCIPTQTVRLIATGDTAGQANVVTIYIGLLSHRMEV